VTLSPYTIEHVFVEYTDGTTNYRLPESWHDAVRTVDKGPRKHQVVNHSSNGFVSNVAKQVGKEVGKEVGREVGKEIVGALFQSGECIVEHQLMLYAYLP